MRYPVLCSKMASFPPSEGQFSEKSGIFSRVKILKNAFDKKIMGIQGLYKTEKRWVDFHDALKIYGAPKLCTVMQ